jgi:hypothetical protein
MLLYVGGCRMSEDTEAYLDKFDLVHRLALRIFEASSQFSEIAEALQSDPERAHAVITNNWPSKDDVLNLLQEFASEKEVLKLLWTKLPQRTKNAMSSKKPENATMIGMSIPD